MIVSVGRSKVVKYCKRPNVKVSGSFAVKLCCSRKHAIQRVHVQQSNGTMDLMNRVWCIVFEKSVLAI